MPLKASPNGRSSPWPHCHMPQNQELLASRFFMCGCSAQGLPQMLRPGPGRPKCQTTAVRQSGCLASSALRILPGSVWSQGLGLWGLGCWVLGC